MRRFLVLALLSLTMLGARAAPPDFVGVDVPEARLAGEGDYTWFGMRIYRAQLWVGPRGYQGAASETAPFVLELRYARALDGKKIAEASHEQMQKLGVGTQQQRLAWLATMQRIFPDVKEGQRIAGAYRAGIAPGVRFYLDGQVLADVTDGDFARAFFAIWLSPSSTAPQLRAALLRSAAPLP
ncbi:chalcone isomerase family protein [Janthinobacterium sp. SUN118]|uniref:chalcone isomerase family protein n=1 Tax=Janthinobacterium sp. SUN118 TaxID=3004100 RepID=UPI0025B23265|nr:chalcone isomerase family protein [Janthinobacterium sp. SUN118]MDN2713013.1 chalcone isomerase family protein [Janthinobacterium sp. SUN118]